MWRLTNRQKKVKAFTLSEMIVVLILTVIVVGLSFTVLNLVQKQMNEISENYGNGTEVNLLRQALWVDFSTYPSIIFNSETNILRCENELHYVDYEFGEHWIVRQRDTFNLTLAHQKMYFDGIEYTAGQIDALELSTTEEHGSKTIFVHSTNAASEYMN